MIPVCDAPFHAVLRGWFAIWFAIIPIPCICSLIFSGSFGATSRRQALAQASYDGSLP
jgi:hypothetical protein